MTFIAKLLLIIIFNGIIFWAFDTKLFPENFIITGAPEAYFFIATIFGLLNMFIKPIIKILTIPFRLLTLGLFSILINGFMLWLLERSVNFLEMFNASLEINKLSTYILAGLIISILNVFVNINKN